MSQKLVLVTDDGVFEFPITADTKLPGNEVSDWLKRKQIELEKIEHGKHVFGIEDVLRKENQLVQKADKEIEVEVEPVEKLSEPQVKESVTDDQSGDVVESIEKSKDSVTELNDDDNFFNDRGII